ncbi:NAD(P)-binding protein [Mytilinidion resinicola]|uniref:NAD(P)-binding protein n=1 Tax=Mytilinidion resinicola TaxID=574789 RepID=A0A6A6YT12_9PEZI|nr:NAD(P)-binding protein [Mytilinidion resinicola]KAF2812086.1 NAD(P)-binding protein [Mytilinidion resinicola]
MAPSQKTVLVIGGTGAQGQAVVKALTADAKYAVHVLTRTATSDAAKELASIPGVTIVQGDAFDEATLFKAFSAVDFAYVNTNGFSIGQSKETYWGIRMYEIAAGTGLKHYLWSGLAYASKLGAYDPKYKCGHLDAKGRVSEFLSNQPTSPMKWSVLSSCLYLDMFSSLLLPKPDPADPEVNVFSLPLGAGHPPLIHLPDLGRYARWMFDTPERSSGLNLQIGTENISWEHVAKTFTEVTGKKAVYKDVTLDEYFASGVFPAPDAKLGYSADQNDSTLMTYRENFSGFWNTWKDNLVKTDYALLDGILPDRVKSLGEWMRLTGYNGGHKAILKDTTDNAGSSH